MTALPRAISFLLFSWVTEVVLLGFKRPLVFEDLKALPASESSVVVFGKFQAEYEKLKVEGRASVGRALWRLSRFHLLTGFVLLATAEAANLASPIFVGAIMCVAACVTPIAVDILPSLNQ